MLPDWPSSCAAIWLRIVLYSGPSHHGWWWGCWNPPPQPEVIVFRKIVTGGNKRPLSESQQNFVKNLDYIPSAALPVEETCRFSLNLADRGLIGHFTSLWPSPTVMEDWVQRNWSPLISEGIKSHFAGKGFFIFVFENAEDKIIIFRNVPYFMGP